MALGVGNIVLLAIGAVLLVTGVARTAVYLVPPGPNAVYQWSPASPQTAAGQQPESPSATTRAPLQSSSANGFAAVPSTSLPQVAPDAAPFESPASTASQGMADLPDITGPPVTTPPSLETVVATGSAAVPVTEAMAPLGDKFLRMWHWVQETGEFTYYDPLVPEESTLKAVASGRTYLILVTESVTLIVNGQQLRLNCDDGDCWNKVVWP